MGRIYLSPPDVSQADHDAVLRALESGWVAPLGPEVDAFEAELAAVSGRRFACALSSGTAGLHLALLNAGVGPGDQVLVSTLTFAATANAIRYTGAEPVFLDSEDSTWNLDPALLGEAIAGGGIKAVIAVDLYGQCADYEPILSICHDHGVPLIEDAAEAIGASYRGSPAGSFGTSAVLSFNGNKIITTSGGGALVSDSEDDIRHARFLATQARDPAPHYQHSELGYNYRLSNLLAALGRAQLADLRRRVERRRMINQVYREQLGHLPGFEFPEQPPGFESTFWLTTLLIDRHEAGIDREELRVHLESLDIEARPVWKPMHLQPLYKDCRVFGGAVSERLFQIGLCLPSGSSLTDDEQAKVIQAITDRVGG